MKKPLLRAALATVAAATLLLPTAASAETLALVDATEDTYRYDMESGTYVAAGSQVNVDLARMVVKHTDRRVLVKARYAELRRSGNDIMFLLRVRTNEGIKRDLTVETIMSGWKGSAMIDKPNGDEVKCRGLRHDIDYDANVLTVSAPRTCFSKPRWVEAFVAAAGISPAGEQFIDHGHMAEMKEKVIWTERIRKG